jgi:hypothetical protein
VATGVEVVTDRRIRLDQACAQPADVKVSAHLSLVRSLSCWQPGLALGERDEGVEQVLGGVAAVDR